MPDPGETIDEWNVTLIDPQAAAAAMARINVGDKVGLIAGHAGKSFYWTVLAKTDYGLTVQGPTNKLMLPIQNTLIYQEELDNMARSALPGTGRARGRPPINAQSAAPVEQPGLPPAAMTLPQFNTPPATPTAAPALASDGHPTQGASAPRNVTLQEAAGTEDWPEKALESAIDRFSEEIKIIIEGLASNAVSDKKPEAAPTCWNCVYVDQINVKCGKFNIVPPMNVICNPAQHCPDFIKDDEIPF
jgi:hypothetical protein